MSYLINTDQYLINDGKYIIIPSKFLSVGDTYKGGTIGYIYQSGDPGYDANIQHGLIIGTIDTGVCWDFVSMTLVTGTDLYIGDGSINTYAMTVAKNTNPPDTYDLQAYQYCFDYTSDIYDDWVFPSYFETRKILENYSILGVADNVYYSSSESTVDSAYGVELFEGQITFINVQKNVYGYGVIPIRYF